MSTDEGGAARDPELWAIACAHARYLRSRAEGPEHLQAINARVQAMAAAARQQRAQRALPVAVARPDPSAGLGGKERRLVELLWVGGLPAAPQETRAVAGKLYPKEKASAALALLYKTAARARPKLHRLGWCLVLQKGSTWLEWAE